MDLLHFFPYLVMPYLVNWACKNWNPNSIWTIYIHAPLSNFAYEFCTFAPFGPYWCIVTQMHERTLWSQTYGWAAQREKVHLVLWSKVKCDGLRIWHFQARPTYGVKLVVDLSIYGRLLCGQFFLEFPMPFTPFCKVDKKYSWTCNIYPKCKLC